MFNRNVKDVYFDLDRYNLRPDDASSATADAQFLAPDPNLNIVVEATAMIAVRKNTTSASAPTAPTA
jgi:hypothetical protein